MVEASPRRKRPSRADSQAGAAPTAHCATCAKGRGRRDRNGKATVIGGPYRAGPGLIRLRLQSLASLPAGHRPGSPAAAAASSVFRVKSLVPP
jgi:hypothetical protein